jgi:microcystin-dependent protein
MLAIVVIENGQKKYIPLTADAGAGNPVGSLLHTYKKSNPSGYLYCDGSTFDQTKYPLLYAYLGSNVLPDYRECVEVGAEQNTTDTIATHDVYTLGQFKDDQLQDHIHGTPFSSPQGSGVAGWVTQLTNIDALQDTYTTRNTRAGTTTHGKQKAVFVYIKATSGLSENAQDNVINTLNEQRSYSTEEVNTGKKWIDGKPIYRKTFVFTNLTLSNSPTLIGTIDVAINRIVKTEEIVRHPNVLTGSSQQAVYVEQNGNVYAYQNVSSIQTGWEVYYTIEYTKTN